MAKLDLADTSRTREVSSANVTKPEMTSTAPRSSSRMPLIAGGLVVAALATFFATRSTPIEPPTTPATHADLAVSTEPVAAQVLLDGVLLTGLTPMSVPSLEVGREYHLRIVKEGYTPADRVVRAGADLNAKILLTAKQTIKTPFKVGGKKDLLAPAPATAVPTGNGTVRFSVEPWGQIAIDGKNVGVTPMPPIKVASGSHTVTIRNSDLQKSTKRTIIVRQGEETVVQEDFLK
jgi:hypothetical protein